MVGYAATALGYLARRGGRAAQVTEIARARDIPGPFLAKIVRQLSARGIVRTRRGVGGGVTLAVDPERLSLLDVCRALHEPSLAEQCALGHPTCRAEDACPLHASMARIRAQQLALLERTTIAEIGRADERLRRSPRGRRKA